MLRTAKSVGAVEGGARPKLHNTRMQRGVQGEMGYCGGDGEDGSRVGNIVHPFAASWYTGAERTDEIVGSEFLEGERMLFGNVRGMVVCSLLWTAGSAVAQTPRTAPFADNLEATVALAFAPGDTSRVFVLGRFGEITIHDAVTGVRRAQPFIDLYPLVCCHNNSNMVGLTFDPNYATNGYFYVHYQGIPTESVVARYRVTANPDVADPSSGTIVHRLPRGAFSHNGGSIEFSPVDGYLYIPTGDSGNGVVADPENAAQSLSSGMGKVLRIDPSGDDFPADPDRNYRIPPSNPFVNTPGALPEIWATGFRNPFQSTFDRATGDFWVADVGQDVQEEIDLQPANSAGGLNYGWKCREGDGCSGYGGCDCNSPGLTGPIYTYSHALGARSRAGGCTGAVRSLRCKGGMCTRTTARASYTRCGGLAA